MSLASNKVPEAAPLVEMPDDLEAVNRLFQERRWGDGLPIVPPTEARVEAMLAGTRRRRHDVIAHIAPGFGAATVERVAINAVMAGCQPEYLAALLAALDAVTDERFNLQAIQATTNPAAVWLIFNGPVARHLGINARFNCLGQGAWANATIGRALRLVLQNIGGALPGDMDRATHGQPGKFTFCCAENEPESPWAPLHVERGFAPEASTVTVVGASGTLNMNTHAKDADDLIRAIADSMAFAASNDYWLGGQPWLILSPEHAQVLHRDGLSKQEVRVRLWRESRMAAGRMAQKDLERTRISRRAELGDIEVSTLLPISRTPEDIEFIVAGGPGTHSVYVPSFGDTRAVTRAIE
ncbi:MAG: hypothetical protein EHM59_19490 [Betaproteobacteria bacterium]|nr:MAG: hypothetical protein EHM59_19490 [Betaproteobacteria bacterium]